MKISSITFTVYVIPITRGRLASLEIQGDCTSDDLEFLQRYLDLMKAAMQKTFELARHQVELVNAASDAVEATKGE